MKRVKAPLGRRASISPILRSAYCWTSLVFDPLGTAKNLLGLRWFIKDFIRYRRLSRPDKVRLRDSKPQLQDRTSQTPFDAHYFHVSNWAARRIVGDMPSLHVDVGSLSMFASLLGAFIPVLFLDYRPIKQTLKGFSSVAGSILQLPLPDRRIASISCLHVAEHIGLGRYGDQLNPEGTQKAIRELSRTIRPGGKLYFAVPVGRPRVCFNAHRIFSARTIRSQFGELDLLEFSGVDDSGEYKHNVPLNYFDDCSYGCGFFWFRRP